MIDPQKLETAASTLHPKSLKKAKDAISFRCKDYLIRLDRMSCALEGGKVSTPSDVRQLSRALSLYQLAYLPTTPKTCPFCIQHFEGNRCEGCAYAATHWGRCDAETSAFGQLIEAIYDLAKVIQQLSHEDVASKSFTETGNQVDHQIAVLLNIIAASKELAENTIRSLPEATSNRLMEIKAEYVKTTLKLLPVDLMNSKEVERKRQDALDKSEIYW